MLVFVMGGGGGGGLCLQHAVGDKDKTHKQQASKQEKNRKSLTSKTPEDDEEGKRNGHMLQRLYRRVTRNASAPSWKEFELY